MKKFYAILCIAIASLTQLQAQAPQGFNYQATVRNSSGDLIVNTNVYFKFNVIQGSQTSIPVFTELHYVPTDDLGQVNLVIGQGTATTGTFSELDWSLGSYYLGIELDTGNGYVAMGTTQLLSVPYALYAQNSGNSTTTTPNLQSVLAENNSANNQQIKDLQDPTDPKDAVNLETLELQIELLNNQIDDLQNQLTDIYQNLDVDGDGFTPDQGDCDDANEFVYPGATEINDGIDNDCDGEVDEITPDTPSSYVFERNGENTVSYAGQTIRLMQADELYSALNDASSTEAALDLMFAGNVMHESGGFFNPELNGTTKLIRSKTSGSANSATNRAIFDGWIAEFANDVAPNLGNTASSGVAGMFSGYQLNAAGQELDQLFFKSLIGAFTLDQIIYRYINANILDFYRNDNTAGILVDGKPYTTMEHKWDEGFGYLYGQVADVTSNYGLPAEGEATGNLLMKYFKKVEESYEPGIAETVYNAFIAGRHAITIADYDARDAAAAVIKTELSKVIGYYAKHYLNDYLVKVSSGNIASAHHSLSEGYGFIFSLQFTNEGSDTPYVSRSAVISALNNNFVDFHNMQDIHIIDMIALIDNAFGW